MTVAAGCGGGPAGLRHRVERGEALYRIGKAYGVSDAQLARLNAIRHRVRAGDQVHQGDVIASVGESGKPSGANLHFEVRKDNIARNPVFFLPPLPARRLDMVEKVP